MIIDKLHLQFPQYGDLRMREIRVDKQARKVFCTLSYPDDGTLDNNAKQLVTSYIATLIPKGYGCSVKYVIDSFTEVSFQLNLFEYIKNRYPIYSNIGRNRIVVHIVNKQMTVVFNVGATTKRNMEIAQLCERLADFYDGYTSYDVSFVLQQDDTAPALANVEEQEKLVQLAINRELLKPSRYFHVEVYKTVFGKEIHASPMYISDVRKPMDIGVLCGKVSGKTCRQSKKNPNLYVCSFALTDNTGVTINCVLFCRMQITDVETIMSETGRGEAEARTLSEKRALSNDKKLQSLKFLADGSSVVVRGKITYGQNDQLEMHAYDLCKCKIYPVSPDKEFNRAVADKYLLVTPEDCREYKQLNFVENISTENSILNDRKFVVLHVNATGLGNAVEDKLVALCAVSVENGKVAERFFTYINPEKELGDTRMLNNCGVQKDRLIFYPTITEIISDLYKFTYDHELVGNDLEHIVALLDYYASPMNYRFDNRKVVQAELLSQLLENSIIEGNVNVSKIEDLAKKCKVPCHNSVFCRDTALTIARCMSILSSCSK